jgi:succinate-semialdehyde dehydrogenase / glutarate-semialdehyde dehydrogenase
MIPAGGQADADEAEGAARRAFPAWKKVTPYDRGRLLLKAASLIEKHGEELAQLITFENGKPIASERLAVRLGGRRVDAGHPKSPPGCRRARRRHGVGVLLQCVRQRLTVGRF